MLWLIVVGEDVYAFVRDIVSGSSSTSFAVVKHFSVGWTSAKRAERPKDGPEWVSVANHPVALSLGCRVIANGFAAPEGSPRGTAGFRPPAGGRVTEPRRRTGGPNSSARPARTFRKAKTLKPKPKAAMAARMAIGTCKR